MQKPPDSNRSLDPDFSKRMAEWELPGPEPTDRDKEILFCLSCNTDLRRKNWDFHQEWGHETKLFPDWQTWEAWMNAFEK